jgi:transcriptional regulator with XRE-family HTH domain
MARLVRTPEQLEAARRELRLTADGLARMVGVEDGRTVRRWEAGEREIPGSVTVLMETALGYIDKRAMILRQLDMLQSGQMRSGYRDGGVTVDDTDDNIARLLEAKASYESALATLTSALENLTRHRFGDNNSEVHWYHLRRLTPKHNPPEKDDWSLPGEVSCERALAYFEQHEGFGAGLQLCDDSDPAAEFVLEQREVLRSQAGASQRLRAGQLVKEYFVRRL